MAKPTFVPPKEEGVSLEVIVDEFMKKIGKTLADVKDVTVEEPFITVYLHNGEQVIIEYTEPNTNFPTRH